MKGYLLNLTAFILIFMGVQTHVNAQAAILALLFGEKVASENFNISMEIGGAFANYSNLENIKRPKLGINFGIGGNLRLSENLFLSPNVYFLAKRNMEISSFSLNSGNILLDHEFQDVSGELSLHYIDVPIFFAYQTNNKKFRFSLGPQISFLQDATAIYRGDGGNYHEDFKSNLESIDYGGIVDFAYILGKAHKGRGVHIHARYYYGFPDAISNSVSPSKNQISFFSMHLTLPFITDELAEKNLNELE